MTKTASNLKSRSLSAMLLGGALLISHDLLAQLVDGNAGVSVPGGIIGKTLGEQTTTSRMVCRIQPGYQ